MRVEKHKGKKGNAIYAITREYFEKEDRRMGYKTDIFCLKSSQRKTNIGTVRKSTVLKAVSGKN